jgi:methionyl-tRNA formyltransferase/glycosyltransferase involved in cell wall biosynthesis
MKPYVSVVIPVYNEAESLPALFSRLSEVLDGLGKPWEVVFINDGSKDASFALLREFHRRRPKQVRVIDFNSNFGQHIAIIAAFERVHGDVVVTLDADLQNPPEEIPKLLAAVEAGHDVVGGYRSTRVDSRFRRYASKLLNRVRELTTGLRMSDHGCMLRAYRRDIAEQIAASRETSIFIPALAMNLATNPIEVEVAHAPRAAGVSKYHLHSLMRLNFDLMTGFSLVPLQIFTIFGMMIGLLSGLFVVFLFIRRLVVGPEAEGLFTLFAILYMLVGVIILGLGIIGEYIGRIYLEVRRRPRFVIREILEAGSSNPGILVFAYHDVGYECLLELVAQNRNVLAVITHEDDLQEPAWFHSVAEVARGHRIPVHTPKSVNTAEWIERIRELAPDIIFSFYYRKVLSSDILAIPRLGAFNIHGSLLPKYRGRSPINWAILRGEKETGATLHYMIKQLDAGDIVDQVSVSIGPLDSARDVLVKVTAAARSVLARQLNKLLQGSAPRRVQDEAQASYFGGRTPADGRIDWNSSAQDIFNLIRAVTRPYPGAFTEVDDKLLYIWWALPHEDARGVPGEVLSTSPLRVMTGRGSLELRILQWEGAAEIDASTAHGLRAGQILGGDAVTAKNKKTNLTVTAG